MIFKRKIYTQMKEWKDAAQGRTDARMMERRVYESGRIREAKGATLG